MEYQLITFPLDENTLLSTIERVLVNRGIKLTDIQHYLNTTDEDILTPGRIDNIRNGVSMLIKHIS